MIKKEIEVWADSFHEGNWCCENIMICALAKGLSCHVSLINGFQPKFTIISSSYELDLVVYGSYKSWNPIPNKIAELIEWGKPDFIAYDPSKDSILFAVEETAATPTGNQATQRCERQYGSARLRIPYWYLVSEYGMHRDGGMRRDSIWPTIAAVKLSVDLRTPCFVLHYSDKENPEDYSKGKGLKLIFESLLKMLDNSANERSLFFEMKDLFDDQYEDMLEFLKSQWRNVIDFLPSQDLIERSKSTSAFIAEFAVDDPKANLMNVQGLLEWPNTSGLPIEVRNKQVAKPLLKHDRLCFEFEQDLNRKKAYVLSNNASSGKPPKSNEIKDWIDQQRELFNKSPDLNPKAFFNLDLSDFPDTGSGSDNRHLTTSKNIVYLYDSWFVLRDTINSVYPRLNGKLDEICEEDIPAFVYVSNSIKPGRLFGDPYTGQLSAYSTAFGKFDVKRRLVIAYFPHQAHTQAIFDDRMASNKGITLMEELTDLILFTGGVGISLSKRRIY